MKNFDPILLIDDDADDCELIEHTLSEMGVENKIRCFNNGKEALHYLKHSENRPFLIFSDLNMPLVNGFELKEQINKDEKLKKQSIPFIFLSTSASQKEIEKGYELSAQGYFKKPDTIEGLKDVLKTVIHYWAMAKHPRLN